MRRALALVCLSSALAVAVAGCDEGEAAVFADIRYSTRCDETGGCDDEQRDICGFNMGDVCPELLDQTPPLVTCSVNETDTTRTVSFRAVGNGFSLGVRGLQVPFDGGPGGGPNCTVLVGDGPNDYEGQCGSSEPSEAQPCQISSVTFRDDMGNPTLEGSVLCRHMPNEANISLKLELSSYGSGPVAEMTPAAFRLANCTGLTVSE